MKSIIAWTWMVCTAGSLLLTGCDTLPTPPRTHDGRAVEFLSVEPGDQDELQAATRMEASRINYRYRLTVIEGYYDRVGNLDKQRWAQNETKNLDNAQTFQWKGLPAIVPPSGESVENTDERLLAEYVASARSEYECAVEGLAKMYEERGQTLKARLMRNVQARFRPMHKYMYFTAAEIPGPDLRPVEVIPEADRLFAKAYELFREGKGLLHFAATTSYPKQAQALSMFREVIYKYPRSTKIALSAYYIGDIYKEYFNEDVRSVRWYERAWQWDPNVTEPARFQAATIYDLRLHNHAKAIELYREAIKHEQFNKSNVIWAQRRINDLLKEQEQQRLAPPQR